MLTWDFRRDEEINFFGLADFGEALCQAVVNWDRHGHTSSFFVASKTKHQPWSPAPPDRRPCDILDWRLSSKLTAQ